MNILEIIDANLNNFTQKEKTVAQYIKDNVSTVTNLSVNDLSVNANVSEASVIRFINKIGYKKFLDFKIQLAIENQKPKPESKDIFHALYEDYNEVIRNTGDSLDKAAIKEAVSYIEKGNHISFFGIASSSIAARAGEDSFRRMGLAVSCVCEGHYQLITAAQSSCNDVFIVFSLTGNTEDIIRSVTIAKKRGAKIIGITSYISSKLDSLSDISLYTSPKENIIDGGQIAGCVSQLFILDCLKQEYIARHKDEIAQIKESLGKSIAQTLS